MASTDQEIISLEQNSNMQRQQQELIKLLAQHFNHQFYQLANPGCHNSVLTNNTPFTLPHQSHEPPLQHSIYPTRIQNQFTPQVRNLVHSNGSETAGLNLITNNNEPNSIEISNQSDTRSQRSSLTLDGDMSCSTGSHEAGSVNYPMINQNPYPLTLNDLNLFSALGLNLTNNQLVLSLQHQSLLRSGVAPRPHQPGLSREAIESDSTSRDRVSSAPTRGSSSHEPDCIQSSVCGLNNSKQPIGKDLLKFSINTILGRGSPRQVDSPQSSFNDESLTNEQDQIVKLSPEVIKSETNEGLYGAIQCDQVDTSSDTNSMLDTFMPRTSQSDQNTRSINSTGVVDTYSSSRHLPFQHENHYSSNGIRNTIGYMPGAGHQLTLVSSNRGNSLPPNSQLPQPLNQSQTQQHHTIPTFMGGNPAFPWTVASRGKPRRGMMRRAVFSDNQRVGLEKRFQLQKYISKPDRKKLAEKLGLRDSQVKIWFQNRRMKWRNSKERELLSAGGSREQTLPTRNNPNPDLSDVGETIKRLNDLDGSSRTQIN